MANFDPRSPRYVDYEDDLRDRDTRLARLEAELRAVSTRLKVLEGQLARQNAAGGSAGNVARSAGTNGTGLIGLGD